MPILLSTISALLERLPTTELPLAVLSGECRIDKCRSEGNPRTDFASGTLTGRLTAEIGTIEICIRWAAEGQPLPEQGWAIREAPHLKGAYIKAEAPIIGDEGPLQADSDELDGLAYDFWSYRDISGLIEPSLPARKEPSSLGNPFDHEDEMSATLRGI